MSGLETWSELMDNNPVLRSMCYAATAGTSCQQLQVQVASNCRHFQAVQRSTPCSTGGLGCPVMVSHTPHIATELSGVIVVRSESLADHLTAHLTAHPQLYGCCPPACLPAASRRPTSRLLVCLLRQVCLRITEGAMPTNCIVRPGGPGSR